MVDVKKIVSSDRGAIVMSILLGFGIATLFRKACLTRDCIVFEAPPKEQLTKGILKYDGKCYKNEAEHVKCDKKKKQVHFKKNWFW
jgi:hypothetical protein